jgi:hypothetical protein
LIDELGRLVSGSKVAVFFEHSATYVSTEAATFANAVVVEIVERTSAVMITLFTVSSWLLIFLILSNA